MDSFAEVGEPVPGEHALDADNDVGTEGGDGSEESVGVASKVFVVDRCAGSIQHTQVHGPGVQVDAGVKAVLSVVEPHSHGLLGLGGA